MVAPERRGGLHGGRVDVACLIWRRRIARPALQPLPGGARQHCALRKEPPFAYVISEQADRYAGGGLLAQLMIDNGLDVYRRSKDG